MISIHQDNLYKQLRSPDYNYDFRVTDGFFVRWGRKFTDDPLFSPYGPELLDCEITTSCSGPDDKLCPWCYKSNTPKGTTMSFETFKKILHKFPHLTQNDKPVFFLTQIALGVDAQCQSNPDVWNIMDYCNSVNIIPNVTIADISEQTAKKIADRCGACAVSCYNDKNLCYNIVEILTKKFGMNQVNIHKLLTENTYEQALELLNDVLVDKRLDLLNAVVFLQLKKKGRGITQSPLTQSKFKTLIQFCLDHNIDFGSDACGAFKLLNVFNQKQRSRFVTFIEPCCATRFSAYCNVEGQYFPCSFLEGEKGTEWETGINLLTVQDFLSDVWFHPKVVETREKVISNNTQQKSCHYFAI